jgi:hypothetical protein
MRKIAAVGRRCSVAGVSSGVLMLAATVALMAQGGDKVDVTGKWVLSVESPAGASAPTMTLKQDGEKLTGKYASQLLGDSDLTGTIKGREIVFSVEGTVQGQSLTVTYKGTVEGKDAMKGSLSLGGLGDGTFTAKRQ